MRFIGEQHVKEDCGGRVPSVQDWLGRIEPARWMAAGHMDDGPGEAAPPDRDRWRAAVAAGETILGFADWLAYGGRDTPIRPVLDCSTGHLSEATRACDCDYVLLDSDGPTPDALPWRDGESGEDAP